MKILYVGDMMSGGSCEMRVKALGEMGHKATGLGIEKYLGWGGKLTGYIFRHYLFGPVLGANGDLLREFYRVKPDMVLIDKGTLFTPETMGEIKKTGVKLVHYTPDSAFNRYNNSRHFNRSIPLYDLVVTTKSYDLEGYKKWGCRKLLFQPPAYDKHDHHPVRLTPAEKKIYASDVTFIGHWESWREKYMEKIMEAGIGLSIWGPDYEDCGNRELIKNCWKGKWVLHEKYPKALSGARISLGFLSKRYPDQTTSRTFEIPACGSMMMAERTEEQRELFREDKEAVYFSDPDELVSKLKFYLSHEGARRKIAAAGHRHCVGGKNSYHDRLREILKKV